MQSLEAVSNLKARVALTCAYGAGLRVSEVCGLSIDNIDSSQMVIHIRRGKGGNARYVMLSPECSQSSAAIGDWPDPRRCSFPGAVRTSRSSRQF